jgi:hypothetical protein
VVHAWLCQHIDDGSRKIGLSVDPNNRGFKKCTPKVLKKSMGKNREFIRKKPLFTSRAASLQIILLSCLNSPHSCMAIARISQFAPFLSK